MCQTATASGTICQHPDVSLHIFLSFACGVHIIQRVKIGLHFNFFYRFGKDLVKKIHVSATRSVQRYVCSGNGSYEAQKGRVSA